SLDEVLSLEREAERVEVPDGVLRSLAELRRALAERQVIASDRRYRQSLTLLRALALVRGKQQVGDRELMFLEHVLWRDPAERETLREVLRQLVHGYDEQVQELVFQSRELAEYAGRTWSSEDQRARARIEVETKLRNILRRLDEIERESTEAGRLVARAAEARREIEGIRRDVSRV
ncbi:MAG TPA: hypothetical protein VEI94_10530, partial [Candidatus Bathyarchaeia archaeon]|nr:hypothetical protein [Candidatus Bathyarchaeia archaeon]